MNRLLNRTKMRPHAGPVSRAILSVTIAITFAVLLPVVVLGQAPGRSLSGRVKSPTGVPIANAQISVKSAAGGQAFSTSTGEDGSYKLANLAPGNYEISASAPGFATVRISVVINADQDQVADLTLASGQQGSSSAVSGVVNSQTVRELPLNGRSASDLAALEPGVETARTQSSGQGKYGFGTQMTISGGRPRQNDARLDGISVNDYANGSPGSALGVNLGVDSVEQFTVLTSNYPAQVGRSSGGVVGATTRSGSDKFHGDVFEFLRNSALDARNFFDSATKPPFRRNQFGASAGGPLWKDHTFIFGDYEGLRQSLGITQVDTVPSAAARAGNLSTGAVSVDSNVLRFVNAFFPLPNGGLIGAGDTGIFTFSGQQVTPENYFTTRVDHIISSKDKLSGTYMFDSGTVRQPDELNNKITGYNSRRQFFTVSEAHKFNPGLLNSLRFGVYRVVASTGLTFPSGNPAAADVSFATVPGHNAAAVTVPGITAFTGGLGAPTEYLFHWTTIQTYDDFSWTHGTHSLKFGAGVERIRDNEFGVSSPNGEFLFNSLSSFLTNQPFSLSAAIPSAVSPRGIRQTIVGTYLQDDWRWRPNFTINLGLRYEMSTVISEVQGKLTVLRNITDATPHLGDPLISNPTLLNFEPRTGFSWDPFRDGKTSVSGGFGIFDVLPLPYLFQMNELFSAPFFESASANNPGQFPSAAYAALTTSANTFRQAFFEPHPGRNYVMQWNFTIQRQLASDLSLRLGYVGSRAIHQPFRTEESDIVPPTTLTPEGYVWPVPIGTGTRLNTSAGRITAAFWDGRSYYDALQVQVKKKIGRASQLAGSYTWGKTIDTGSGSMVGDEYTNSISSPLFFNLRLNRGLADFNVSHNLSVNYTWELGTPKWKSAFADWGLGGWQLGGVFQASTGVPFTPGFAGDTLGVSGTDPSVDVPDLVSGTGCGSLVNSGNPNHYIKTQCFAVPTAPNQAFFSANCDPAPPIGPNGAPQQLAPGDLRCFNLRGNLGRNTLIGPGLVNFDFSLFKNNFIKRISDTFNAQFRAEFFNVFNRANFAPPLDNRNVFDATGNPIANAGLITSTQTPSRQIQFALKLIW